MVFLVTILRPPRSTLTYTLCPYPPRFRSVARPPRYKVARGGSEVYLKDNAALVQYLVDAGFGGLVLETAEGSRSGADLRTLVDHARRFRTDRKSTRLNSSH